MTTDSHLLVKGIGGLGNRLLCLLTATLYARLSGRALHIDWGDAAYSDDGSNVFAKLFTHKDWSPTTDMPTSTSVAPAIWQGHLDEPAYWFWQKNKRLAYRRADKWRPFSIDLERLDYDEQVVVMWSFVEEINRMRMHFATGAPELCALSTREILGDLCRRKLNPVPEIQKAVTGYAQRHFGRRTIGVHIRYTDKKVDLRATLRRLDRVMDSEPDLRVFLATDSAMVEQKIRQRYPDVISTEKEFPQEGGMHRQFQKPGRLDHGREAVLDIYLLSKCDILIGDMSSAFVFVASLIADLPPSRVHNIQRLRWLPPRVRWWLWLQAGRISWY